MRSPKLTSLDLTVLLNVTGGKSPSAAKRKLTAALDSLKSGLSALRADGTSSANEVLPLAMFLALNRGNGGGGGAPAQLGLPQPPAATPPPIAAKPARSVSVSVQA